MKKIYHRLFSASFVLMSVLSFSNVALASSTDAWNEAYKKAIETCVKESGLADAKPVGKLYVFDDTTGYVLEVEGKSIVGKSTQKLKVMCLVSRDFKSTQIQEGLSVK
ncbi:MAG: hypothetical protein EOP04_23230 [Proteobacteria bacterium]|nr:MAG: hypothetical protein EOP04_23230 [Pseudomonadota bacterium]